MDWKEACQEGDLEAVEAFLSQDDADINGDHLKCYEDEAQGCITGAPYYTPLGESARYGHVEVVKRLLEAGAVVDRLNYRSETALHQALAAGKTGTAKLLLEAGANPNLAGCLGNGVTSCRLNKDLVDLVLSFGADPTVPDPWGQTTFDALVFDIQNPEPGESKRALGILAKLVDVWPQDHLQFEPLKAFVAEASEALMSAKDRKKLEAKKFRELGRPRDGWVDEILAMLDGDLLEIRPTVDLLVKHTLSWDAPVSSPEWPAIVERLIDMTPDYSELTEEVYGERLSVEDMDEDEGGVLDMISDERLCTAEDVFTLLAKPAALARPDYAELFTKMCEVKLERLGHYNGGQDELEELLGLDGFGARADADKLRVIAGKAYPFI